jgi:hypothetical protein
MGFSHSVFSPANSIFYAKIRSLVSVSVKSHFSVLQLSFQSLTPFGNLSVCSNACSAVLVCLSVCEVLVRVRLSYLQRHHPSVRPSDICPSIHDIYVRPSPIIPGKQEQREGAGRDVNECKE